MIALFISLTALSYCLIVLIQWENRYIYQRDSQGRFTAKLKKHTARKFKTVCDIRREVGLHPYGN